MLFMSNKHTSNLGTYDLTQMIYRSHPSILIHYNAHNILCCDASADYYPFPVEIVFWRIYFMYIYDADY